MLVAIYFRMFCYLVLIILSDDNFFYMTYKKKEIFFLVTTNRLWAVSPLNFLNLFYLFCSEQSRISFIVGLNNGLATMPMNIIIE